MAADWRLKLSETVFSLFYCMFIVQNESHVDFVCTGGCFAHRENHKKVLNCRANRKSFKCSVIYSTYALQIGAQNLAAVAQTDFLGAPEVDFVLLFTSHN